MWKEKKNYDIPVLNIITKFIFERKNRNPFKKNIKHIDLFGYPNRWFLQNIRYLFLKLVSSSCYLV